MPTVIEHFTGHDWSEDESTWATAEDKRLADDAIELFEHRVTGGTE